MQKEPVPLPAPKPALFVLGGSALISGRMDEGPRRRFCISGRRQRRGEEDMEEETKEDWAFGSSPGNVYPPREMPTASSGAWE